MPWHNGQSKTAALPGTAAVSYRNSPRIIGLLGLPACKAVDGLVRHDRVGSCDRA